MGRIGLVLLVMCSEACDLVFVVQVPVDEDICDALFDDSFTDPIACMPRGEAFETNSDLREESGQLAIAPRGLDSNGGCRYPEVGLHPSFVAAEISTALTAPNSFTGLQQPTLDRVIAVNSNMLVYSTYETFTVLGEITYAPELMRWVRLVADRSANTMTAEYSPDGKSWTPVGMPVATPFVVPEEDIIVIAGYQDAATGETASFERVVVCN